MKLVGQAWTYWTLIENARDSVRMLESHGRDESQGHRDIPF